MEIIRVTAEEKHIIEALRDRKNQEEYGHYIRAAYNNYACISLGAMPNDIGALAFLIAEFDNI